MGVVAEVTAIYSTRFAVYWVCIIVLIFASAGGRIRAEQTGGVAGRLSDPAIRQQMVELLLEQSRQRKNSAWQTAQTYGWSAKRQSKDTTLELMAIRDDRVYFYTTCNSNAAISIGVDSIRNTFPYDVNGAALTAGVWDAGAARASHQELTGRVTVRDGAANHNHSTHVSGTIGAAGIVLSAEGMAPAVMLDSYEWTNDVSEMTSRAMSYPGEADTIQVSNHSYGYVCGWELSFSPSRWYGQWGYRESDYFGQYDSEAAEWDEVCYNGPYYLPFKAAGNSRNDSAPAEGQVFEYFKWPKWRSKTYDSSTDPYDDGWDDGGFDTILPISSAKNIVTVGAVYDAVSGGVRDVSSGAMASFSGWGPADDGRIKPDIVANGIGVYSSTAGSDTSYASYSGTSCSTPGAAGAAILLVDYYGRLFAGQAMRASTLKGLMIHTADDLGREGPDYEFGWGLLNAKAAAEQIRNHYRFPDSNMIAEDVLNAANPSRTYIVEWDGSRPICVTLCWTDPPGPTSSALDDRTARLVNDLDLRVAGPNGAATYEPFVLDASNPDTAATTGDNILDNVEQVLIEWPGAVGEYTIEVSHKGVLANGGQYYSLIISGQFADGPLAADFNYDGSIDFGDLEVLSYYWLEDEESIDISPWGGDGIIDFLDFAKFAEAWGQ